jgi:6-phosphogluconolactonase
MYFRPFKSRTEASMAAAELLAEWLGEALDEAQDKRTTLVVSGGSTPGPCFDHLSGAMLDWQRVTVIPSDERWVPAENPDSNERLVRSRLLKAGAAKAGFFSLFREDLDAEHAAQRIHQELQAPEYSFSSALLGMGEDGHFASLFPDYQGLSKALDPNAEEQCVMVKTDGSPYLRISLTLSAILAFTHIALLIFGEEKRRVLESAQAGGTDYPIESLLQHGDDRITVIWAP